MPRGLSELIRHLEYNLATMNKHEENRQKRRTMMGDRYNPSLDCLTLEPQNCKVYCYYQKLLAYLKTNKENLTDKDVHKCVLNLKKFIKNA